MTDKQASPVFGLRYLEDRDVEGLDVVGCLVPRGGGDGGVYTATGCDDVDQVVG
jgi:Ribosomally synthesized peptide in Herpetosiphon